MSHKETELKAVCNICIAISIIGILVITVSGGDKSLIFWGYALNNIGSIVGIFFGSALEKAEGNKDGSMAGTGYIARQKMYTFEQYIQDNDTSLKELRSLIKMDRQRADERAHDIYEHYKASARGNIVSEPEDIYKILLYEGREHTDA